ncbi:MAG: hypothetical protein AB8D78_04980 [Akkermansiaceae bacterium]
MQRSEVNVKPGVEVYEVVAKIYPQFWQANLKRDQSALVPIEEVVSFGLQDYEIVGGGHVYEFTLTLKHGILVRFYSVSAPKIDEKQRRFIAPIEGQVKDKLPAVTGLSASVVKQYGRTTHLPMMEFGVDEREDVMELFESFRTAYLDFSMRELVEPQRDSAVRLFEQK